MSLDELITNLCEMRRKHAMAGSAKVMMTIEGDYFEMFLSVESTGISVNRDFVELIPNASEIPEIHH